MQSVIIDSQSVSQAEMYALASQIVSRLWTTCTAFFDAEGKVLTLIGLRKAIWHVNDGPCSAREVGVTH